MIDKTLTLAEQLGDRLAKGGLLPGISSGDNYTYIQLKPLKDIEQALALWQGLLRNFVSVKQHIDLIVSGNRQSIMLIIGVPAGLQQYVENIYFANFATSDLQVIKYTPPASKTYLNFGDEEIAMDADFIKNGQYMDPFKDVMSVYDMVGPDESMDLVYRCRFKKSSSLLGKARKIVKKIARDSGDSGINPPPSGSPSLLREDTGDANQQVEMKLCYSYLTNNALNKEKLAGTIKSVYLKYLKGGSIKLKSSVDYRSMGLNQFVNFYHFMSKEFVVPNLEYATYRKLPAPTNVPSFDNTSDKNDLTILGYTDYKSDSKIFGIRREDKLRHMYVIGQTGTGKSKFIANMVRSDMISNKGVCVIDPHGDLIDDILSQVPSYRTNDVVLFDVADREFPVGFNVFEYEKPEEKPLIASGIVGIFKKMFGNSWGPRLEYILRNVILSLLEYPNATFLDLIRMLTDDNYKEEVLEYVKDPILMKFWRDEFDKFQPKQREEAIAPIANKVGQFTSSTIVRNIFGQSKTKMNFRKMMDEGKIILINLSKGKVGEDNMAMIGSFIASKIQIDAMSRADIDESQRRDFYLYIDEFQNFATESFATILSEARKYKLALIMANQYISQIDELVRNAIFGNVGTIVCNRIGKDDAEIMSQQFKGMASTNDFLSLPNRRCYAKLMINGMVSDPFSMKTADFVKYEDFEAVKAKVRDQSRQRYAMPRLELEALMKAWAEKKFTMAEKVMEKAKAEAKAAKEKLKNGETILQAPKVELSERFVQERSKLFTTYEVGGVQPDAILIDAYEGDHKAVRYQMPPHDEGDFILDAKRIKGGSYEKDGQKLYDVKVTMCEHTILVSEDLDKLDIRIGSLAEVQEQIKSGFTNNDKWKLLINTTKQVKEELSAPEFAGIKIPEIVEKIVDVDVSLKQQADVISTVPETTSKPREQIPTDYQTSRTPDLSGIGGNKNVEEVIEEKIDSDIEEVIPELANSQEGETIGASDTDSDDFTVNDLVIGNEYSGYVKLKYNYGLFVTVYGVEGLLHKNFILSPEGVSWKKLYEIGDPIMVKAMEFKEIEGEKRVVRTQI